MKPKKDDYFEGPKADARRKRQTVFMGVGVVIGLILGLILFPGDNDFDHLAVGIVVVICFIGFGALGDWVESTIDR